jgi:hypothetical protein
MVYKIDLFVLFVGDNLSFQRYLYAYMHKYINCGYYSTTNLTQSKNQIRQVS